MQLDDSEELAAKFAAAIRRASCEAPPGDTRPLKLSDTRASEPPAVLARTLAYKGGSDADSKSRVCQSTAADNLLMMKV